MDRRRRRSRRSPSSSRRFPPPVHPRRRSPRASGSVRREAARRERDRGPLRAADLRDGRREPGLRQRGPRDLRPGDEVILLSPYYFNHEMAITLASAVPVPVPVDERLQPDLPAIAAAITEKTRAVVTVSPNNPTGAVYPQETLAAIHRLCAERGSTSSATRRTNISPTTTPCTSPPAPRRGARDLPLQPLQGLRHGELARRFPRGAGAPAPRPHEGPGHGRRQRPAISQFVGLRAMREGRGIARRTCLPSREYGKRSRAPIRRSDLVEVPPRRAPSTCS